MIAGVADTHTALWYLLRNPLLSASARNFIDGAAAGNDIVLSPISLAEIIYLTKKNRLPVSAYEELKKALSDHQYVIEEAPFNAEVVEAMRQVPRSECRICPTESSRRLPFILAFPLSAGMEKYGLLLSKRFGKLKAAKLLTLCLSFFREEFLSS